MEKLRFVGLDVHKESIAIAVADRRGGEPSTLSTIPNDTRVLLKQLRKLGRVKCCYEAGPTGFGLQRELATKGIECVVVAPSLVPQHASDRVKTDRRDAIKLARFLRSGDLTKVHVPEPATETMRDLERDHEAQNRVLVDHLKAVEDTTARVESLTKSIEELVEEWSLAPLVKALQALRGIRLVSAVVIAAELGELKRFAKPTQLMGFVGLVPSEHSSGASVGERADPATKQRSLTRGQTDRLESTAAALRPLSQADGARQEQAAHRNGYRSRARRFRLVDWPTGGADGVVDAAPTVNTTSDGETGLKGNPRTNYGNGSRELDARC